MRKKGTYTLKSRFVQTARVPLRIDCETISGPGQQRAFSETEVTSQEHGAGVQGTAVVPIASRKRRAEAVGGTPTKQEVLNLAASKYLQTIDPSNGFVYYLENTRKVRIVDTRSGSLIITVECSSLEILEGLWEDYCTGYFNEMAQKYLVTDDILKELGLTEVKLATTILAEEYRACREHLLQYSGEFKGLLIIIYIYLGQPKIGAPRFFNF